MYFPCTAFSTLRKSMGVRHSVLAEGQPWTVALAMLAQLCAPKVNGTEVGAA